MIVLLFANCKYKCMRGRRFDETRPGDDAMSELVKTDTAFARICKVCVLLNLGQPH